MNAMLNLKKYNDVGIESSVYAADPHKLIMLLYQGALLAIATAKNHMLRKEIVPKGRLISQAISIIEDGLNASLNKQVGGEMTLNLSRLYLYMCGRLFHANMHDDVAALDEVSELLAGLRSAWESIAKQPSAAVARQPVLDQGATHPAGATKSAPVGGAKGYVALTRPLGRIHGEA